MDDADVRMPVLKRLVEQSMSDADFRAAAATNLDRALAEYGYDLNDRERDLVMSFRDTLEVAGVDLFLTDEIDLESIFASAGAEDLDQLIRRHKRDDA